jgi:hypothetical protein
MSKWVLEIPAYARHSLAALSAALVLAAGYIAGREHAIHVLAGTISEQVRQDISNSEISERKGVKEDSAERKGVK